MCEGIGNTPVLLFGQAYSFVLSNKIYLNWTQHFS